MSEGPSAEQQLQEIYLLIAAQTAKAIERAIGAITDAAVEHIKELDVSAFLQAQASTAEAEQQANSHMGQMASMRARFEQSVAKQNEAREQRKAMLQNHLDAVIKMQAGRSQYESQRASDGSTPTPG